MPKHDIEYAGERICAVGITLGRGGPADEDAVRILAFARRQGERIEFPGKITREKTPTEPRIVDVALETVIAIADYGPRRIPRMSQL